MKKKYIEAKLMYALAKKQIKKWEQIKKQAEEIIANG